MTTPIADDRLAAIRQKFDEPLPESWIAENEGDELIGTFVRLEKGTTSMGDCWIVVVESARTPGRYASVWLFHEALVNAFAKAQPKPGELIGIRYGGKKPVKHPTAGRASEYHDWKVVVDRVTDPQQVPRWDLVGGNVTTTDFHSGLDASQPQPAAAAASQATDDDIPF